MIRILGLLFLLSTTQQIKAQCCSAGNPSSDGGSNMEKKSFTISSSYIRSYSDSYFNANSRYNWDYLENTKFDFGLISLSYGISNRLAIATELGYFINKSMSYSFIDQDRIATGLGDFALDINYLLVNLKPQLTTLSTSIKTTIPIGEFDQMDRGVILPIDIQPSAGSYKLRSSIGITKRFYGSKFTLNSFLSSEFSQRINTERTDYKYGNLYNLIISASHRTSEKLNIGLGINYTLRKQALNRNIIVEATGGEFVIAQPKVAYQLPNNLGIQTSINIPVYNNVNGIQLVNKYIFVLGLTKGFSPKKIRPQINQLLLESFNESSYFVDGICGMCKTRIEDLAYKAKGVKWAEWNLETKQLLVKFDESFEVVKLAKTLSKGGHDNWMITAKDKAYNNLHSCCKYRGEH